MYAEDFLKINTSREKSFKQATIIESKPIDTEPNVTTNITKLDGLGITDGLMFLIPFSFMLVGASLLLVGSILASRFSKINSRFSNVAFRRLEIWEVTGDEMLMIEHFHQLPCRNCRYFTNNPYLKCAVQPSTALTIQALNCSDYCPQKDDC